MKEMLASDFPPFPEVSEGESLNFAASELAFLAEKTTFACSTDTIRLNLNGVYLEAKDGVISMIATDGHRLGRASIEQEGANLTNGANILIGVTLLKKINEDDLYSIMPLTERDKQIIDLMDNEKFNYLVDENSLDEIKYVIEELNIEG